MTKLNAPAEVAVVLGAAVWPGGVPSTTLRRRVQHAARLIRDGAAEHLLLTGGVGRHPPAEADVMRVLAEEEGVPPSRILLEPSATTTLESAARCAAIITAKGWQRVLLVTDGYHVPRALLAFRAYGVRAQGSAPAGSRLGTPIARWVYLYAREIVAVPWYALRLAMTRARQIGRPR